MDSGAGYSQNLTTGYKADFATYLDYCFFTNGKDVTRSFNGTSWSSLGIVNRAPIGKYLQTYATRLYIANLTINSEVYPSRVWYTDLPNNNKPRWGLEWGSDLTQTASSDKINSVGSHFDTYGIDAGDPVWILDGANAGQYTVESVTNDRTIVLVETLTSTATGSKFIVGNNYFDVRTDDNEQIMGMGENSNRLLIFKLNYLYRYNGSSLLQVPGAPGTSSGRSIVNVAGFTFYFHGSQTDKTGIYMYNGSQVLKVSSAIQPYIDGINVTVYDDIVGWREGDTARFFVGTVTNSQRDISMSKVVLTYYVKSDEWSIDPIDDTVKCSATFVENNAEQTFIGNDSAEVFLTPSGYDYDAKPISWVMETGIHYPEGSEMLVKFRRIQVVGRDNRAIRCRYKLVNQPKDIDTQWWPLDDLENDKTELHVPTSHNYASGINLRLQEDDLRENTQSIEKISIFYTVEGTQIR